jgi:hypothetical protein
MSGKPNHCVTLVVEVLPAAVYKRLCAATGHWHMTLNDLAIA